jgi:hypothetical protein
LVAAGFMGVGVVFMAAADLAALPLAMPVDSAAEQAASAVRAGLVAVARGVLEEVVLTERQAEALIVVVLAARVPQAGSIAVGLADWIAAILTEPRVPAVPPVGIAATLGKRRRAVDSTVF